MQLACDTVGNVAVCTIPVEDLDASLQRCKEGGGTIVTAIRGNEGEGRYCVIQDPAGAYLALMQTGG